MVKETTDSTLDGGPPLHKAPACPPTRSRDSGCWGREQRSEGSYGNDKGCGHFSHRGEDETENLPQQAVGRRGAALAVAEELRRLDRLREQIGVIFATGAAQFETLEFLTSTPGLPWKKVQGFHLDEYVGLDKNHPSFFSPLPGRTADTAGRHGRLFPDGWQRPGS